jgi:sugar O-acyltransferase (sialic acid O-acetyltransferase NeuD family)
MRRLIYAVYGASGCGRGIMPIARQAVLEAGQSTDQLYFIDDLPSAPTINGHHVVTYANFIKILASERYVALAIANSAVREKLAEKITSDGVLPWALKSSNVVMMDNVEMGVGALLSPFVTLTSNIRIGRYFHANLYSYVEHDCVIGDFVTFAPGVKCNGNIVIQDHAYIGSGAVIHQGYPGRPLTIGRGAIVGMGAVVINDVSSGSTVAGNPARLLKKG